MSDFPAEPVMRTKYLLGGDMRVVRSEIADADEVALLLSSRYLDPTGEYMPIYFVLDDELARIWAEARHPCCTHCRHPRPSGIDLNHARPCAEDACRNRTEGSAS